MAKREAEQGAPGSSQDEKAPQDETPGGPPEKTGNEHDIGVRKRKPKPGEEPAENVRGKK